MSQPPPCDRFDPGANPHRCARCGWVKGRQGKRKKAICAKTGLVRYPTPAAARVNLHRLMGNPKEPPESRQKLMSYPCEHCHGFHLGHHVNGDDDVAVAKPRSKGRELQP